MVEEISYGIINGKVYNLCFYSELEQIKKIFKPYIFCTCIYIQDDQKVSGHLMITVQKTRKNIFKQFQ
jgi:hypothetical protein